ncbi:Crp/Fnr family transcriptional regulator [Pedobacter aquatilis]|uniref:Crp/Fnr family transcriptional regulator n=1 Tax=Pedobacter aquatilis TaxID=351343 RepID=UPI00292FD72D|nr:Crp/Fnr family transcriptional regulator [Pedobacter aquatilis]
MDFKLLLSSHPYLKTLPQADLLQLQGRIQYRELQQGQHLLMPDEICKHIHFIVDGFFRIYHLDNGLEATIGFAGENQLFTLMKSFFQQKRRREGIICEVNAKVFSLSYHDLRGLEDASSDVIQLGKTVMEQHMIKLHKQVKAYRLGNATQKYLYLCSQFPKISHQVSQKHIASYLGITEQTMSLIRKSLLRKT